MRRITRRPLDPRASAYLARKRRQVLAAGAMQRQVREASRLWPAVRATKTFRNSVLRLLHAMAGQRERCMYCEDSRGTDVEHFWPKSIYPARAFDWDNLLLACINCQRHKGDRLPLDHADQPQLIDPTSEDPWDFFIFVPETGQIAPRFDAASGSELAKGRVTIDLLKLDYEAVNEGRRRVWRRLVAAVRAYLAAHGDRSSSDAEARAALTQAVRDNDDYGLRQWFFLRDGGTEKPFVDLMRIAPEVFAQLQAAIRD